MNTDTPGAVTQAIEAIEEVVTTFMNYYEGHLEKETLDGDEKAQRNLRKAQKMERVLESLREFKDGVPESLTRKLQSLDTLEEHMNKHGSFGMSEPEPWAVCRSAAKHLQEAIK